MVNPLETSVSLTTDAKDPACADSNTAERGATFWAIDTACSWERPPEGVGLIDVVPTGDALAISAEEGPGTDVDG
jgi:hypothetical protein